MTGTNTADQRNHWNTDACIATQLSMLHYDNCNQNILVYRDNDETTNEAKRRANLCNLDKAPIEGFPFQVVIEEIIDHG